MSRKYTNSKKHSQLGSQDTDKVISGFVNGIRNRAGIHRQNNNTLAINQGYHTNTNIHANVSDLGMLALQPGDQDIRQRAIYLLFEKRKLKNDMIRDTLKNQRAHEYLANSIFLISFIGGLYLTQHTWLIFSKITNISSDLNILTAAPAPAPTPSPSWYESITNPFSCPPPPPSLPPPSPPLLLLILLSL